MYEGPEECPCQGRHAGRSGTRGCVAGESAVEQGGTGEDLCGPAEAEDGVRVRIDVAPPCGPGVLVVARGQSVAGGVGVVGAEELDLSAQGGVGGQVLQGLRLEEGGVEDGTGGSEVVGLEEVGGKAVRRGLEG